MNRPVELRSRDMGGHSHGKLREATLLRTKRPFRFRGIDEPSSYPAEASKEFTGLR